MRFFLDLPEMYHYFFGWKVKTWFRNANQYLNDFDGNQYLNDLEKKQYLNDLEIPTSTSMV